MTPHFPAFRRLLKELCRELALVNEYYAAQIEIYRHHLPKSWRPNSVEKATLSRMASRLGRSLLSKCLNPFTPETLLSWQRDLVS